MTRLDDGDLDLPGLGRHRPADVLLIRPDAHIAWATTIDEPADRATLGLRAALSRWFGAALSEAG